MKARASRLLLVLALAPSPPALAAAPPSLSYGIDLNRRTDDLFHVTLRVSGLRPENAVYQFAATAPGTYQVMNIGRYVRTFEAFDARGRRVPAARISVNQWRLSAPARVRTIRYAVTETWDSPLDHPIYKMCGTSIEADHVLLNPHAVIGYPEGLQAAPVRLRLAYPAAWKVGTALKRNPDGVFVADNFDQLVDSPILLGPLSRARLTVTGVPIDVYAYSRTGRIEASQLLVAMAGMLNAAGRFLGKLPVDRYTFLYHFSDESAGAWEHSFSSEYVLEEGEFSDSVGQAVTDIAAHEFFHIVTPLNIHSEIIEHFNFVTPVPSRHLWLYEGTTEWASHALQLRAGLKSPEAYLQAQLRKMQIDRQAFDSTYSLRELALSSYSDSGQAQYGNIYMRGALTAGLLDIRLLELSQGERGLQDLVSELTYRYGKRRAFPDSTFVDTLVAMTHPEIRDFLGMMVWTGRGIDIERNALIAFDLLLVLVLGLLLYSISARDPQARPGAFDLLLVLLLVSALVADAFALAAIGARISEFGFTPNRVAALGENVVLLGNLGWSTVLYVRFLRGRGPFASLERWQTAYLPAYSVWAAIVVVGFPPVFGFD